MIRTVTVVSAIAAAITLSTQINISNAICQIVQDRISAGDLSAWYNPCREIPTKEPKLSTWSTGFTEKALLAGLEKKIPDYYNIKKIPLIEGQFPVEGSETYVGWDQGKVVNLASEKPLYSTEFGPCVAVLARGYKDNSKFPSHLALHHIFTTPSKLTDTLRELIKQIGAGKVEVFISGGQKMSQSYHEEIQNIIKKSATKNCQIAIVDNTFRIADLGTVYKCSNKCYPMNPGIPYVGFTSKHQNPVQIIGVSDSHKDVPDSSIRQFVWI